MILENTVWEREQPDRCCFVSKNGVLENAIRDDVPVRA